MLGGYEPEPWFSMAQFHLVEIDHARRFAALKRQNNYAGIHELRRSYRGPYRRAVQSLAEKREPKLTEFTTAPAFEDLTIQGTAEVWLWPTVLARLTDSGRWWVQENALELVKPLAARMMTASVTVDRLRAPTTDTAVACFERETPALAPHPPDTGGGAIELDWTGAELLLRGAGILTGAG
ncbi:MAG: hypothetical protein JWN03_6144 [Nocardia sp.]|nr:hypothetical protein [Nocardia sp.]